MGLSVPSFKKSMAAGNLLSIVDIYLLVISCL